jgi:peroxiredoxin
MTRLTPFLFLGVLTMATNVGQASTPEAKDTPATPPAATPAATPVQLKIGDTAPDFELTDTAGKVHKLSQYADKTVVLEWFNPDCPFVRKHHQKTTSMHDTQAFAAKQGVVWLAVNSGAPGKQGAGLDRNKKAIEEFKIAYPLLLDESGAVGKSYGAKTTPHMFVISKGKIVYAGAIDDRPDAEALGKVNYVREVLTQVSAQKAVNPAETKPYGCSVKYAS